MEFIHSNAPTSHVACFYVKFCSLINPLASLVSWPRDLEENALTDLGCAAGSPFAKLSAVRILSLKHNRLTHIHRGCFTFNSQLIELDLAHNSIQFIHPDAFHGLSRLSKLWVFNITHAHLLQVFAEEFELSLPHQTFYKLPQLFSISSHINTKWFSIVSLPLATHQIAWAEFDQRTTNHFVLASHVTSISQLIWCWNQQHLSKNVYLRGQLNSFVSVKFISILNYFNSSILTKNISLQVLLSIPLLHVCTACAFVQALLWRSLVNSSSVGASDSP